MTSTLDKYRVSVCFFLANSNKSMRILVPCQDSWTINRLKDEAVRRLLKNMAPNNSETDTDERLVDINVKHIENLSKDILDGDDIIRDVLDNKEILVARLEGDQDMDFFNNEYLVRAGRSSSIAGDSVHSTMLTGGHMYPESIHLPIRAETEMGTPERHSFYRHHSYLPGDSPHQTIPYSIYNEFMCDMHPPPRAFAPDFYQGGPTDYEKPRIQPRMSLSRPDSCNSDIPQTSDSSNFMNTAHSRSPSVLSEENRAFQPPLPLPLPLHSHTFSNPEQTYHPSNISPLAEVPSGDTGFSNNSHVPHLASRHSSQFHAKAAQALSLPLCERTQILPNRDTSETTDWTALHPQAEVPHTSESDDKLDTPDSPSLSPPPVPFGRKYRPSVMHGYINPAPNPIQDINPISEESAIAEEEPVPHQNITKTLSNDVKSVLPPKVTLRLITRGRSIPKEPSPPLQRTDSPLSVPQPRKEAKTPVTRDESQVVLVNDVIQETGAQLNGDSALEVVVEPDVATPTQVSSEEHIEKVIKTAIKLPEERHMDSAYGIEFQSNGGTETSPHLPQKRARTSASPLLTPLARPINTIQEVCTSNSPPPAPPEAPNHIPAPANAQSEEQSPDAIKPTSLVGVTRGIGAIFVVELEKGMGGLGFGIKSRDTAADGMTYPHFVSSLKSGGVAQADGRLKVGDLLLEVNDTDVTSLTHIKCLDYMRKQRGIIKLKVSRQNKSRGAGDPDGESYTEARIDDRNEVEPTMDLLTPQASEEQKPIVIDQEDIGSEKEELKEEAASADQSLLSIVNSNTSLDEIDISTPVAVQTETPDTASSKRETRRDTTPSSTQSFLRQVALTETTIYTQRGKKIEPLKIALTDAGTKGLGVSVRGKTRLSTNGKAQEGGIFVKAIVPGGAADKDGRLKPDDQILSINGCVLVGQTNLLAMETLKLGLNKISPNQPVIKLVVSKKSSVTTRTGKRAQRPQDYLYARKLSLSTKSSTPSGYANTQLPSIYHPICMEELPKNGEGRVFSVLDSNTDFGSGHDKSSNSPPPNYESLLQGHIYEQLDTDKKRSKKGALTPADISRYRTAIQRSSDPHEDEHIYARPQRRNTEEGIYTRPTRVLYGRIGSKNSENSLPRTPTYSEEIYAQPTLNREEKSKRKSESIYEAPLMVKPKYGEGVFLRKPREHLYESVNDAMESETMDTSDSLFTQTRPLSLNAANPYEATRSLESPTDEGNPYLSVASKSMSLQKTPSGGDVMQPLYANGRSTPRGPRTFTSSRAVPHAPISSSKRPRSRTGRIQYPTPIDLSPYFTSVQQQQHHQLQQASGKQPSDAKIDLMPIPLTEPPVRDAVVGSDIYKTTIKETSQPTPNSTPHRPLVPSPRSPFDQALAVDLTFASDQDDSLGPMEFTRKGQGRDDISERHPFAKDAKQLSTYKEIQYKHAEEKLKAMSRQTAGLTDSPQTQTHPMSLFPDSGSGNNMHVLISGSASTPSDKNRDKLAAGKRGSFFGGLFKKKKGTSREKNLRDTPSPLLDAIPPTPGDHSAYTDMLSSDDN